MTGFLGSTIIEVAMGITFVYLFLALLCSTVNEWIATLLDARASNLRGAIQELLNDQTIAPGKDFLDAFNAHPLITGLMEKRRHPSYIPSRAFALAVMDISTPNVHGSVNFDALEDGIKNLPPGDVRTALLAVLQNAQGDLNRAQRNIEGWFDDAMERASGWYRRRTQVWIIFLAAAVTLAINADTINIAKSLWTSPTLRGSIVAQAGARAPNAGDIDKLGQLMGWTSDVATGTDPWIWLMRILGWILTTVAVSMGAPFWFEVLNKFVNLRNAGPSPSESPKSPEKPIAPPADKLA
jgi:hypothetical protein